MCRTKQQRFLSVALTILLVLLLGGMAADLIMTSRILIELEALGPDLARETLPCGAIPSRYVMEEPVCTDKLLRAMNVSNVRVLANSSELLASSSQTIVRQ